MNYLSRSRLAGLAAISGLALAISGAMSSAGADEMEDLAKAEGGKVVVYHTLGEDVDLFVDALKVRYPWIDVEVFGGSPSDIRTKFITEVQAGLAAADIIFSPVVSLEQYREVNGIASVALPNDSAMPKELMTFAPELHPIWQVIYVMPYNTDLGITPPADAIEMADPKWKDQIAFDRPANAGAAGLFLASRKQLWGEEKWNEWLTGLQANNISITTSANTTYAQVLQGERQIGIGGLHDILNQQEGTPVAANFYKDVVSQQWYGFISRIAPHPNTAALMLNWMMSEEGQQLVASTSRVPARVIDSPMSLNKVIPAGATVLPEAVMTDWVENTQAYLTKFAELWPE
jgi:ABC-type Fe3+ transport system substrate-binding protein